MTILGSELRETEKINGDETITRTQSLEKKEMALLDEPKAVTTTLNPRFKP